MASVYDSDIPSLPLIWSIDRPVGRGQENRVIDLYLIQFFLRKVINSPRYPGKYRPPEFWEVDGRWQDSLHAGIQLFQTFILNAGTDEQRGLRQLVNGRVDPVLGTAKGKFQGMINSTMLYLDRSMRSQYKDLYDNLLTSREVPGSLHFGLHRSFQEHMKRIRSTDLELLPERNILGTVSWPFSGELSGNRASL